MSNLFRVGRVGVYVCDGCADLLGEIWTAEINAMKDAARIHLKINGRVQGVYFRASTVEQARRLGLTGWVMNCPDSSVEVVAEGEREQLEKLMCWCHTGPPGAQVRDVRAKWEGSKDEFQGFSIKR